MNPKEIRVVFFGTPYFATVIFGKLITAGYSVVAVFTQPDKKVGRTQEMKKSVVKELAEKNSIPVFEPQKLDRGNARDEIAKLQPDVIIVSAYGKIIPKPILEIPKYGAINVHASLLPKFRGASPIQESILSGEEKTGVTLMLMNERLDAGEIINQEEIAIEKNDNTLTLTEKLADVSGKVLIETLPLWISGAIKAIPQNEKGATHCRTIKKEDGKIDWNDPAETIFRKWRAYYFWPGIFTSFSLKKERKRLRLMDIEAEKNKDIGEAPGKVIKYKGRIAVQTKKGLVVLGKVQLEGKKIMSAEDFSKGHRDFLDSVLA